MSQQRPNARHTSKRSTVARGEQKQVSGQSEPSSLQSLPPPRDDRAAWLAYWQERNQPWRTEPEICPKRQAEQEKDREGLDVRGADLQYADLHRLPLKCLRGGLTFDEWLKATEEQRNSAAVLMRGANLFGAQLEGTDLNRVQLEGANLAAAQLEGAHLLGVQLMGADLRDAVLGNEDHIGPYLADAQWGTSNLAVVDWAQVTKLSDEWKAEQKTRPGGEKKGKDERLHDYRAAVRANRQLAVALQAQGLSEEAARFAYRA